MKWKIGNGKRLLALPALSLLKSLSNKFIWTVACVLNGANPTICSPPQTRHFYSETNFLGASEIIRKHPKAAQNTHNHILLPMTSEHLEQNSSIFVPRMKAMTADGQ